MTERWHRYLTPEQQEYVAVARRDLARLEPTNALISTMVLEFAEVLGRERMADDERRRREAEADPSSARTGATDPGHLPPTTEMTMTPDQLKYLTDEERRAWEACEAAGLPWAAMGDPFEGDIRRCLDFALLLTDEDDHPEARRFVGVASYALPLALEALADARRDLAWHETRHGTRAEQEADDAADAAEEERQKSLTDEQIHAELTALGVDILASRARFDGTLRLCSMLADARRERDEARAELANERGEGEPPGEGWTYSQGEWDRGVDDCDASVYHSNTHWTWMVRRNGRWVEGSAPTARAAMRAADAAVGGAE